MQSILKFACAQLLFCVLFCNSAWSQSEYQLPTTNLIINVDDQYVLDANSALVSSQDWEMIFLEMAGINYQDQLGNFRDLEAKYAAKGIALKKQQEGKISQYDAMFVTLETEPATYQVFFGNTEFCAVATVKSTEALGVIDETEINSIINTVQYKPSTLTALEEHAHFTIVNQEEEWEFLSYTVNVFGFEHKNTDNALLILQLPPETLAFTTKELLAQEFVDKFQTNMPNIEVIEKKEWQVNGLDGYKLLLDVSADGQGNLGLVYMFIFGNEKATFAVQGMGKKNDDETKAIYDKLVEGLRMKE